MTIAEHQKKALEALHLLRPILEEHGIQYYLLAGSALGAVRHSGFIPWDDDIDIGIKYEDAIKLDSILRERPLPGFRYVSVHNDPSYPRLYGKILYEGYGCIDLFPLVRISDNPLIRKLQWLTRKVIWKLYSRKVGYVHPKEIPVWLFVSRILSPFFSKKALLNLADRNCRLYDNKNTEYYINFYSIYSMKREMIPAKCVDNPQQVSFEGDFFPSLGYLDEYLSNLYGDYMTPVPPSEQVATHTEIF